MKKYLKNTHKKKSTRQGPTNSAGTRMTEEQSKQCQKSPKIPNQKNYHTGPTNSMGKSFSNRNEFTLVAVGKGLVA